MIGRLSLDVELTLTVAGHKLADIQAGSVSIECEMESKPGGIIVKTVPDIDAREAMRAALKNALAGLDASEPPKCDHEKLRRMMDARGISIYGPCADCGLPVYLETEPPCEHESVSYTPGIDLPKCVACGERFQITKTVIPRDLCDHGLVEFDSINKIVTCVHCGATRPTNAEWPAY